MSILPLADLPGNSQDFDVPVGGGSSVFIRVSDFSSPWEHSRQPVLLHPGFGRSGRIWFEWVPALSRRGPVIQMDPRGFGRSVRSESDGRPLSLDGMVEDVARVMDWVGAERYHYIGESLGGVVGLFYAAEHGDKLCSTTLVSTPSWESESRYTSLGFTDPIWEESLREHGWGETLRSLGVGEWFRATNGFRFGPSLSPTIGEWLADEVAASADPDRLAEIVGTMMDRDYFEDVSRRSSGEGLRTPCLVISAVSGAMTSESDHDRLASLFTDPQKMLVPSDLHYVMFTHRDQCIARVLDHLETSDEFAP